MKKTTEAYAEKINDLKRTISHLHVQSQQAINRMDSDPEMAKLILKEMFMSPGHKYW